MFGKSKRKRISRRGTSDQMRRMVDRLIDQFGVLNDDGTINNDASLDSWLGLIGALERLFSKYGVDNSTIFNL